MALHINNFGGDKISVVFEDHIKKALIGAYIIVQDENKGFPKENLGKITKILIDGTLVTDKGTGVYFDTSKKEEERYREN